MNKFPEHLSVRIGFIRKDGTVSSVTLPPGESRDRYVEDLIASSVLRIWWRSGTDLVYIKTDTVGAAQAYGRDSKWSILQARADAMREEVYLLERQLEGFDQTKCGLTCSGCGEYLETEGDFGRHFMVINRQHLNLGNCPVERASMGPAIS